MPKSGEYPFRLSKYNMLPVLKWINSLGGKETKSVFVKFTFLSSSIVHMADMTLGFFFSLTKEE